jgi:hypothetical protein
MSHNPPPPVPGIALPLFFYHMTLNSELCGQNWIPRNTKSSVLALERERKMTCSRPFDPADWCTWNSYEKHDGTYNCRRLKWLVHDICISLSGSEIQKLSELTHVTSRTPAHVQKFLSMPRAPDSATIWNFQVKCHEVDKADISAIEHSWLTDTVIGTTRTGTQEGKFLLQETSLHRLVVALFSDPFLGVHTFRVCTVSTHMYVATSAHSTYRQHTQWRRGLPLETVLSSLHLDPAFSSNSFDFLFA